MGRISGVKGESSKALKGDVIYKYESYGIPGNDSLDTVYMGIFGLVMGYVGKVATGYLFTPDMINYDEVLRSTYYVFAGASYFVMGISAITLIVSIIQLIIFLSTKEDGEERNGWELVRNNLMLDKELGNVTVKDLNKVVLVGDETKEDVLPVRRLYALLKINSKGEVYLTEDCRTLKEVEEYRKSYCKDAMLDESGMKKLNNAFKLVKEDIVLEERIEESEKEIKEVSEELNKERELQHKYLVEYHQKYGETSEPTNLLEEKQRLDIKVEKLDNKLGDLTEDLGELHKQVIEESKIK